MAEIASKIKSILAVDCGNVTTSVILIEMVEGHYHLTATGQAQSTLGLPWQDITLGISAAIRQVETETQRVLLAPGGWPITPRNPNNQGVDAFIVVSSAGPPLTVTLAGLTRDISLTSARRAAAATYSRIAYELSLDSSSDNSQLTTEARLQAIRAAKPETILFAGGADGGAERPVLEIANILAMALQMSQDSAIPDILFAGNNQLSDAVLAILGGIAQLKVIDNVRPALDTENLAPVQLELERRYSQYKMIRLPGFAKLKNWSKWPITPASQSFEKMIAYLGQHHHLNVAGLDIGSRASLISTQAQNQRNTTIRTDAGLGHSLASLLKVVPLEKLRRWLPFEISPEELHNALLNKSLHPASLPTDEEALLIEYAVAREALRLVTEQARASWPSEATTGRSAVQWNLIIGAGGVLTRAPHLGYPLLTVLDGFEPWGVTKLMLDVKGVSGMLGSLAAIEPVAAVEVTAHPDTFLPVGTIVAPLGHGPAHKTALRLKLIGAGDQVTEVEVDYGQIEIIPLAPGQKATLEMRPSRYFDIGLGQPGRGAVAEVEGGLLGLIIDGRGRPLRLADEAELRHDQLRHWLSSVGLEEDAPHEAD
jgi:hypothetical protein